MEPTMALPSLRALLELAGRRGLDAAEVARRVGAPDAAGDEAAVPAVERRVPLELACAVWEAILEHTRAPAVSLEATSTVPRGAYEVLGLVVRTAGTGREAFQRAARYMALWSDTAWLALEEPDARAKGEPARLAWRVPPVGPRPGLDAAMEASVASTWRFARRASGDRFAATRVCFAHPSRGDEAAFERFFGAPVAFGAPRTQLEFDRALLDLALGPVDAAVDAYLLARAEELLARMPRAGPVTSDVRRAVSSRLAADPSLEAVAKVLGVGSRTLRRRLTDEHTTFARVVDEVRREAAARELSAGRMGVGEIALALGYSEPGAFVRAFKRWTGSTPGAWRATHPAR